MVRVLVVVAVAAVLFAAPACARYEPASRPTTTVTTSVERTTTVPPSTEVTTSVAAAPTTSVVPAKPKADQREAACRKDEDQCYEPGAGAKCQTGGCVNAGRGMTQRDVEKQRDRWLREHPGWCPAGETGAVARC
ncbi:hypothetical protein [Amycolatopsis sp. EV170708-02-1]|uniref:hypothetical protein n=1 Tax=Amycolatopsis sp. EV170708-02-1 TaxID=2919322 RepID=UPI001F0C9470|nr:hypothetical protein [Amycolatopsis sp. EV170708-02-1]UMP04635.1 hypothetical protein MJQ72_07280 [Amycolatopsis sp. EV170708-02-1]